MYVGNIHRSSMSHSKEGEHEPHGCKPQQSSQSSSECRFAADFPRQYFKQFCTNSHQDNGLRTIHSALKSNYRHHIPPICCHRLPEQIRMF